MAPVRWGILSTGFIAGQFADGLRHAEGAELVAVGSRTQESANKFKPKMTIPHRHGSYEALANDPDVDVIYIGTPHPFHKANTMLCLNAGKAVLCEKPFAINAAEAREMVALARSKKLFLMEAMWTRFIPLIVNVREWVNEGRIGDVRLIVGDFGFYADVDELHRLVNPELAGGALLDVGVYPVSFAQMIYGGPPSSIASLAQLGETNVDIQCAVTMQWPNGAQAFAHSALTVDTPIEVRIIGTAGEILVHAPFYVAQSATIKKKGAPEEVVNIPIEGNGYNYQALEVMRCMREGLLESPGMPLDESVSIMETLDTIRTQIGVRYPGE